MRKQYKWTEAKIDKLNKVRAILTELDEFKPLTLRQIYYQLVGKGFIENNKSQYTMLSQLLKYARIDGAIEWEDMEDRVRSFFDLRGWKNSGNFIYYELNQFLSGYRRDLLKSQDSYLEVWIEKDALSSVFQSICRDYTVPVVVCKGFSSVSYLHEYRKRLNNMDGKKPILLYFGDFDPSGVEMLNSMEITLRTELNIKEIEFKRVALHKEDIFKYNLPHDVDAIKKKDSRAKKHIREFGELAVELDALPPAVLQEKIRIAIQNEIDMDKYFFEKEEERVELNKLILMKDKVETFIIDQ